MATRGEPTSLEHVKALNMIDLEFYDDKSVSEPWEVYRKHLNLVLIQEENETREQYNQKLSDWGNKKDDLFTDMLYSMSQLFKFNFDKKALKEIAYLPRAYESTNIQYNKIKEGVIKLLQGESVLKVQLEKSGENHSNFTQDNNPIIQ